MGLLDFLNPDSGAPDPVSVPLSDQTNREIDTQAHNAIRPTKDFADVKNAGVDEAGGLISSQNQFDQNQQSLGMSPGATGDAIRNKYKVQLGNEIMKIKSQNTMDATTQKANDLTRVQGVLAARTQLQIQAQERLLAAQRARQAARSSFLNTIFSAAGMAAGMALAGPAAPVLAGAAGGGGGTRALMNNGSKV